MRDIAKASLAAAAIMGLSGGFSYRDPWADLEELRARSAFDIKRPSPKSKATLKRRKANRAARKARRNHTR